VKESTAKFAKRKSPKWKIFAVKRTGPQHRGKKMKVFGGKGMERGCKKERHVVNDDDVMDMVMTPSWDMCTRVAVE
jgi:hypothetical protein